MLARTVLRAIVLIGVLGWTGSACAQDRIKDYFNEAALKVKATEDPVQKREILIKSLSDMSEAIDKAKSSPLSSDQDEIPLGRIQVMLQERSDELAGVHGFEKIPDKELNAFSTYIVQDMEQAQTVTISVVVLLLIIIIIILIA